MIQFLWVQKIAAQIHPRKILPALLSRKMKKQLPAGSGKEIVNTILSTKGQCLYTFLLLLLKYPLHWPLSELG